MHKVLLLVPPLYPHELYTRGSQSSASILPPLGLAYIAAYIGEQGFESRIIDGLVSPMPYPELLEIASEYDIVGISVVSTYAFRAIEMIKAFKDGGLKSPIVVGGPHVTALPESLLTFGADYAVLGEGEVTSLELFKTLTSGGTPSVVKGIAYLEDGALIKTEKRSPIANLDDIPIPARDLLDMELYSGSIARAKNYPSHSMLASRGCPGVCTFCSKKTFGTKVRRFSIDRIAEEMFLLRDKYGANDIALMDDNFTTDFNAVHGLCEILTQKNFGKSWSVEARVDGVDKNIFSSLKQAGCDYIAYGIESGSQRVLNSINKKIDKAQIRETIQLTKEAGLHIRGYFIIGFPGETLEEIRQSIEFAIELDIDVASFTLFLPLPGTVEYRRALTSGTFDDPEYYHHEIIPEFNFPDKPYYIPAGMTGQELLDIHRIAYNKYYMRPKMLLRHLKEVRSPSDLVGLFKGGLTLLKNFGTRNKIS
ncbi:MAG: B12-binding domain-containing radical SAM protein [Pseudodesulfovibrio sp.]